MLVEQEIEKIEKEKSSLETALNSGELSPSILMESSQRYSVVLRRLEELEYRWLELSEKRV